MWPNYLSAVESDTVSISDILSSDEGEYVTGFAKRVLYVQL